MCTPPGIKVRRVERAVKLLARLKFEAGKDSGKWFSIKPLKVIARE